MLNPDTSPYETRIMIGTVLTNPITSFLAQVTTADFAPVCRFGV